MCYIAKSLKTTAFIPLLKPGLRTVDGVGRRQMFFKSDQADRLVVKRSRSVDGDEGDRSDDEHDDHRRCGVAMRLAVRGGDMPKFSYFQGYSTGY